MARPKSKLDLWKGWEKEVLNLYADGGSDEEIFALIWRKRGTFSDDLFRRWLKEEPEFSGAINKGRALARAKWLEIGRKHVTTDSLPETRKLNTGAYNCIMRNRFGWDRKEAPETQSNTTINFIRTTEDSEEDFV